MLRALVVLLVLLAPPALAQQPFTASVDAPTAPQRPLANVSLNATLVVPCRLVNVTGSDGSLALQKAPAWLAMEPTPTRFRVPGPCVGDATNATVPFVVRIQPDAAAFASARAELVVALGGETTLAPFALVADYFVILDVSPERTVAQASPQSTIEFPITVTNRGNGLTRVTFETDLPPAGWVALAPPTLTLPARQSGNASDATVHFVVQTPHGFGSHNDKANFTLRVHASSALGVESDADDATLTFTAVGQGFDTPAPALPLVVLALVAAALVARRFVR